MDRARSPLSAVIRRTLRRTFVLLLAALLTQAPTALASSPPCWTPPVQGTVTDEFRAPACPYCAGNRGLEYATTPGRPVRAVASGTVDWAGTIAHVRWVVVRHADGLRVTYGRMASANVSSGDMVLRGAVIAATSDRFYLGVRRDDDYIDPAPMLGRLVGRHRLVPIDGRPARAAPPPVLRCGR